ncbi:hypothetical protein HanHA300_Chr04g0156341 [Helianthus annuus]|nr:hypothetical protein HanHA300_Chr04g0156341 [Helianthus annuus]
MLKKMEIVVNNEQMQKVFYRTLKNLSFFLYALNGRCFKLHKCSLKTSPTKR